MTSRERFEAWVSASGRAHLLERDHPHLWYKDLTVAAWWTAWQAAERQALERVAQYFEDSGDPEGAKMIRRLQDAQSGDEKQ